MKLAPGLHVTPRIVLQRPLGEGAMAAVWQAHHAGLDAAVAVKFLFTHAAKRNPRLFQRFRSEASVAAKIRSPYVVQMLDYGVTEDGRPFLVMEMLEGEPLDHLIARRGALALAEMTTVVQHVCKALAKAHAMGVVHRDIKPGNLFNVGGEELFIKVLDFGIAKQDTGGSQGLTLAGEVTGTPRYMSPEQLADSKDVDGRTDIWAVGVVAYQLLTGRFPFGGDTLADLYLEVCSGRFAPPTEGRSPELDAWFARMLARDRDERFPTAEEAAAALPASDPTAAAHPSGDATGERILGVAMTSAPAVGARSLDEGTLSGGTMTIGPGTPMAGSTSVEAPPVPATQVGPETAAALVLERPPAPLGPAASPPRGGGARWLLVGLLVASGGGALAFLLTRPEAAAPATASSRAAPDTSEPPATAASAAVSAAGSSPLDAPPVEPSASAADTTPTAPSSHPIPAAPPRPAAPRPAAPRPTPVSPKPNCQGDNAYIVNEKGHLIPKPGCM